MALMAFKIIIKVNVIVLVNNYADKESCFHYEIPHNVKYLFII